MSVNEKMTAIADEIRKYTTETDRLSLDEMPRKISRVHDIGFENGVAKGESDGYQTGYTEGETAGVATGKQAERDTFWKNYIATMNSNYNSYYAFAGFGWNNNTFRPTRNMYIYNATNMFSMSRITDLAGILEEQGVTIDFSGCSQFNSFAYDSKITHFPIISTVSASSLHGAFDYCYDTHTIDKLILKSDGSQTLTYIVRSCTSLKNIIISGKIGVSFDIHWSPLTKASIESVINALSTTATGKTLSLKKNAVNTAFGIDVDDETTYPEGSEYYVLRHSRDNWTFSYV